MKISTYLVLVVAALAAGCSGPVVSTPRTITVEAPFEMPAIEIPAFRQGKFDIRDYGAVADGTTVNTKAFAAAIEACNRAGGGRVLVPSGKWLTGPIHLKSNVNLHLSTGSEVLFSTNFEDYLPVVYTRYEGRECYNYSAPVYARDCVNIAVTGPGTLNGRGKAWWGMKASSGQKLADMAEADAPVDRRVFGTEADGFRPSLLQTVNCRNVLLEDFTITDGPMWTIHPIYSENIVIRGVTILTHGPNGDGIDPDSCRNVLIENCRFDTSDDAIAIKSGMNRDGRRVGKPSQDIVVRNCQFGLGKDCDGVVSIGSDMSGGVRNVYIHDCRFDLTQRAVRIKSKRGRGGVVENIYLENITAGSVRSDALLLNMFYGADPIRTDDSLAPVFRNIYVKNLTCARTAQAIRIAGLPDSPIENVRLEKVSVTADKGLHCSQAKGLWLDDVELTVESGPVITLENTRQATIRRCRSGNPADVFLELKGAATEDIRLQDNDLSNIGTESQKG